MFRQRSGNVVPNVDPDVRTMFDQRPGNVQATLTQRSRIVGDQNLLRNPGSVSLASLDDMGRDGAVVSNNDQGGKGAGKVSGRRCRVVWGGGKKKSPGCPEMETTPLSASYLGPPPVVDHHLSTRDASLVCAHGAAIEKSTKGRGAGRKRAERGAAVRAKNCRAGLGRLVPRSPVGSATCPACARCTVSRCTFRRVEKQLSRCWRPPNRRREKLGVHRPPPAAPSFTSFPVRSDLCDTSCNAVHECQCRLPGEKAQNGNIPRRPSTAATKCRPRTPRHLHQWMSAYSRGLRLNIARTLPERCPNVGPTPWFATLPER